APASDRATLDAARFACAARHQLIEGRLHRQLFFAQRFRQLLDRRLLIRCVNGRFQCRFSLFVSHSNLNPSRSLSIVILRLSDKDSLRISTLTSIDVPHPWRSFASLRMTTFPALLFFSANPLRSLLLCVLFFFCFYFLLS